MPTLLTKREYKKLLSDLQRIIREGKEEAERAASIKTSQGRFQDFPQLPRDDSYPSP